MNPVSIHIFVKVVEAGSFTAAAQQLRLPKSTVSRAISSLESDSGTKLMIRTTRAISLTEAGQSFFDSCRGPVHEIEAAHRQLEGSDAVDIGRIRVGAPEDLGAMVITPELIKLAKKNPMLRFEFSYSDDVVDLVKEGIDFSIRAGRLPSSSLKAIKVGAVTLVLAASRAYLSNSPPVREPKDLKGHSAIGFRADTAKWTLISQNHRVTVPVNLRYSGNHMRSMRDMAAGGLGIALIPNFLFKQSSDLVRVLPDWHGEIDPVYIVSPITGRLPTRVKLAMDHMANVLRQLLL